MRNQLLKDGVLLISVEELKSKFGISPTGILHVGAHLAEEQFDYQISGWASSCRIIWVESQPELTQILTATLNPLRNRVINATVWSESGIRMKFHLANNSQSSSLLAFGTHAKTYPEIRSDGSRIVTTVRLDEIIDKAYDISFLNLDIQGAELQALQGLGLRLNDVKYVYSEVNKEDVYEGCAKIEELDLYLNKFSFKRVATRWAPKGGWGDALWIKRSECKGLSKAIIAFKINELLRTLKLTSNQIKHDLKIRIKASPELRKSKD